MELRLQFSTRKSFYPVRRLNYVFLKSSGSCSFFASECEDTRQISDSNFFFNLFHIRCGGIGDRAILYLIEITIVQSAALLDGNQSELPFACYVDEAGRKFLDFNFRHWCDIFRLLGAIVILKSTRYVIVNAHAFYSGFMDVLKRVAPRLGMWTAMQFVKEEDIVNMVEDTGDIPGHFCNDGRGKPYLSTDRRNVWCYERCLSDENRITQKDLYNPDPWPYEEVDYRNVKRDAQVCNAPLRLAYPRSEFPSITAQRGASRWARPEELETIAEDGDDDEW